MRKMRKLKFDPESFIKTEMGGEMEETIRTWGMALDELKKVTPGFGNPDQGMGYQYWNTTCQSCQARWEIFQLAIRQFYGIEIHFTRTEDYFGVCIEDEELWLFKFDRMEK